MAAIVTRGSAARGPYRACGLRTSVNRGPLRKIAWSTPEAAMPSNRRSANITQGVARAPNRSMYYAMGYVKSDFDKPMIGIANGHSTITPCNSGLQKLTDVAIKAVRD